MQVSDRDRVTRPRRNAKAEAVHCWAAVWRWPDNGRTKGARLDKLHSSAPQQQAKPARLH